MGASPNLIKKEFLPPRWNESFKLIKSFVLRTVNRKVLNIEVIVPFFLYIGDGCVRAWFGDVKNLAVDLLLGWSFIYRCLHMIFVTKRKVVLLAFQASGDYLDEKDDQFDKRQ